MAESPKQLLKKELNLLKVYAIATGTTLSAGFFLLPGLAFTEAGPAMVLSYMIAAIPLIPAMFSMVELATAMPRAGGAYYFLDRSMGPLVGTIGGLGTWLALILKASFALIGMGAYVTLFWPNLPIIPIAAGFAVIFGLVNLFGAKKSGSFQVVMVIILLSILSGFIGHGMFELNPQHFAGFFDKGTSSIFSTAGLVYISYVGITKIASVAEEIKNPVRNLPLGVFLAIGTSIVVYGLGTTIMVGVVSPEKLAGDLTPVATTAEILVGPWGKILVTIAAIVAFSSVVNAGILSASRYPLAMSRDHLIPSVLKTLSKRDTPKYSIFLTVGIILILVTVFDPTKIAKLASAFQLMMFALICLAVIVMRESKIESYDPGYCSPFYPWMQIFGILSPFWLIIEMGWLPTLFTASLICIGTGWYFYYAQEKVVRTGAIYHLFARLGQQRFEGLDTELRGILKEKGLRDEDPFEELIARASVIDLHSDHSFERIVQKVGLLLSKQFAINADTLQRQFMKESQTGATPVSRGAALPHLRLPEFSAEMLESEFLKGSRTGATPVSHGAALPHLRLSEIRQAELVLVRCIPGSYVLDGEGLYENPEKKRTHAFFFLVSPNENPGQHLRILAQIAGIVDEEQFMEEWLSARDEQELKETLLGDGHFISLRLRAATPTSAFIGHEIRELQIPEGSLITSIRRRGKLIIPRGNTMLKENDRLTIIGDAKGIQHLYQQYEHDTSEL
ncbi:MAG: amino acid permease [SAR324 cluster bacterium]|nr:amino acid permease [SAR324 cluster bacterium]